MRVRKGKIGVKKMTLGSAKLPKKYQGTDPKRHAEGTVCDPLPLADCGIERGRRHSAISTQPHGLPPEKWGRVGSTPGVETHKKPVAQAACGTIFENLEGQYLEFNA
jgi:hypothetical protein